MKLIIAITVVTLVAAGGNGVKQESNVTGINIAKVSRENNIDFCLRKHIQDNTDLTSSPPPPPYSRVVTHA